MPRIPAAIGVVVAIAVSIGWNIASYPVVWEMVASSEDATQPEESLQTAPVPQAEAVSDFAPIPRPESHEYSYSTPEVGPIADSHSAPIQHYSEGTGEVGNGPAAIAPDSSYGLHTATNTPPVDNTAEVAVQAASGPAQAEPEAAAPAGEARSGSSQTLPGGYGDPSQWPAEMSPSMKYTGRAAPPKTLPETDSTTPSDAQGRWTSSRPLVPVAQSNDLPGPGLSPSQNQSGTTAAAADNGVCRLPPVDPNAPIHADQDIRFPDTPIPVYPGT